MFLLKNPQYLCNHFETWSKCGTHELLIFTKFCNDCIKIVDFLIKAYFWVSVNFAATYCINLKNTNINEWSDSQNYTN